MRHYVLWFIKFKLIRREIKISQRGDKNQGQELDLFEFIWSFEFPSRLDLDQVVDLDLVFREICKTSFKNFLISSKTFSVSTDLISLPK